MFKQIVCVAILVMLAVATLRCVMLTHENKALRAALNEPVNCEAMCEVMFEEMGC